MEGAARRFNAFFGNCTKLYGKAGCQVDIMAVHYYGCTTADFQRCALQAPLDQPSLRMAGSFSQSLCAFL